MHHALTSAASSPLLNHSLVTSDTIQGLNGRLLTDALAMLQFLEASDRLDYAPVLESIWQSTAFTKQCHQLIHESGDELEVELSIARAILAGIIIGRMR